MRIANKKRKFEVGEIEVILAYADNVIILNNTRKEVVQTRIKFLEAAKTLGLEVNRGKTKYMSISRNDNVDSSLQIGYLFAKVTSYKYLTYSNINGKNNTHEEIKERVASANLCYYSLFKLFKSKLLSMESKIIP